MTTKKNIKGPLLSEEFLDELAKEINEQFGGPTFKKNEVDSINKKDQNKED